MGEFTSLAVLGVVAVLVLIGGLILHRRLNPKPVAKKKAGRPKGGKGAKEEFVQDISMQTPSGKGEVWQDDNLFDLREGKDQGVYKDDEKVKKKDDEEEYESWDKYS